MLAPRLILLVMALTLGSGEGTQQFLSAAVDFGASDAAMSDAEARTPIRS
jgi:ABC-type phosphate transport system substrate-binding protein